MAVRPVFSEAMERRLANSWPSPAQVAGLPVVILEAPSNLGLMPPAPGREPGVRRLPEALARAGLPAVLPALWGGRVDPPTYSGAIDPETGIRNAAEVAAYAEVLAGALSGVLERPAFPLLLGGDCSILLGATLALRRRGRYGLVFLDAHDDFSTPETSASRGAAAMELALATGRGPERLANLAGLGPLVRDEDVLVLGAREGAGRLPVRSLRVEEIRSRRLEPPGVGFWIHLDVDVLDPSAMPAVDSPEPEGLETGELSAILRALLATGRAAGMQVTIYDPDRDPDGSSASVLVSLLAAVFAPESEARR
jgi:arginase